MNVVSRGVRNAFRNPIRTFSLVVILGLSVGLALTMLVAYQAVGKKIASVKGTIGNIVSISPAGVRGFDGGGNPLTQDQLKAVATLPHVTSVDESLSDRLTTSDTSLVSAIDAGALGRRNASRSGQSFAPPADGPSRSGGTFSFTPPVTLTGTTSPSTLPSNQGGGILKVTSGTVFDAESTENVAVLGSSLASKNNLVVGSTFTAYGKAVSVVGIFDAGNTFANNQVIMPLASVQTLSAQPGSITSATANIDSITNVDSATTSIKNSLGDAADVTNSAEQAKQILAPLENIQSISLYSLIGAVGAGAVIILLTMVMIVRERRREIGVIKAIGASNIKVMYQFMVEAVTLTLLGAIVGVGVGVLAANPITKLLVTSSTATPASAGAGFGRRGFGPISGAARSLTNIQGVVNWTIVLYGLAAAVIIALLGSMFASFFIAKVRPAEVMRAE